MHTTQTRTQLALMLLRLSSERGLASVSLSDLADAMKLKKASIYSHFASKEELVGEMYRLMDTFHGGDSISLEGEAEEVLERVVRHWVTVYTTEPMDQVYRVVFQLQYTDERARFRAKAIKNMFKAQTQVVLETLSDSGRLDIPDLDLATTLFSSAVASFIDEEIAEGNDENDWAISRMVSQFCKVFSGVTSSQGTGRR